MSEAQGFRLALSKSPSAEGSPFFTVPTSGKFRADFNLRRLNCQNVSHDHKRWLFGQIKSKFYVTQHCSSLHVVSCYSVPSTFSQVLNKKFVFFLCFICVTFHDTCHPKLLHPLNILFTCSHIYIPQTTSKKLLNPIT